MTGVEWDGRTSVAVISWKSPSGRHGGTATALRCSHSYGESHWRTETFGEVADDTVTKIRPLVVIDPEDREQITSLVGLLVDNGWRCTTAHGLRDALREFANPTPPKPAEPTGLGAVVEDADGDAWVHDRASLPGYLGVEWLNVRTQAHRAFCAIDAVRVLSEGVTP